MSLKPAAFDFRSLVVLVAFASLGAACSSSSNGSVANDAATADEETTPLDAGSSIVDAPLDVFVQDTAVVAPMTTANLLVNGDAEDALVDGGDGGLATTGWSSTGDAQALPYGTGAYPALTDPVPPDPGLYFFAGGNNNVTSTLTQIVDVSAYTAAIDAGDVTFTLDGWLGGYSSQNDNTTVTATFDSGADAALGEAGADGAAPGASIGPVLAADRSNTTEFLERTATGGVPAGTRSVIVVVTMTRTDGSANDGYADDLSLVFHGV